MFWANRRKRWFLGFSTSSVRSNLATQKLAARATRHTATLSTIIALNWELGEQTFRAAVDALRRWQHFQLGWVRAWPTHTPIQVGATVAVIAHAMGVWCLNACRIVYVVDEHGPVHRFGFAYGTLPGHVERGEERFLLEWVEATGSVSYDILAFSRPNHVLTKIGYPYVRRLQKRFALDSMAQMQQSVLLASECDS